MILDQEMTIGQRFKKYRKEKGLSQQQLSEGICSYSTVSQIECDRALPSVGTLEKLAERLSVPLREILGEQERMGDVGFQLDVIRASVAKGDYEYALERIAELEEQELLEHQRHVLFLNRAECLMSTGESEEAAHLVMEFVQAQEKQQTISDDMLCDAYYKLGKAYYYLRDFEKSYSSYQHGYHISLRMEHMTRTAALVTLNLGVLCGQLGFEEDAQQYLDIARKYFEDKTDLANLAKSLLSLAIASKNKETLIEALSLYNAINDIKNAYIARQYYLYHYESQVDYKEAVGELQDIAFKFDQELQDPELSVYLYGRAFMISYKSGDSELAEVNLIHAERVSSKVKNQTSYRIAYLHRCKALNEISKKNFENAIIHSLKSSGIYDKMKMYSQSAESLQISAEALSQMGRFEDAFEVLKRVNKLLRRNGRELDE